MKSSEKSASWARPIMIGLLVLAGLVALFVAGYVPRRDREKILVQAADEVKTAVPQVMVARAQRSPGTADLVLPGNVTPMTEALINARASGYLKTRLVDIGDHVVKGQVLAEIDAPDLDEQVRQAEAGVAQTKSALTGAQYQFRQATAKLNLAKVTAERWRVLVQKGVVSRQESDTRDADLEAQQAAVDTAQAAVRAAEDNIRASEANLRRLLEMQAFEKVVAPFAGIVTARNVDIGSLIPAAGSPPLFRIAQIGTLRIMVDVPQNSAAYVRVGGAAEVTLQELPGRKFSGTISRTANALDPATRTLPAEVEVANPERLLLPNMYAQVRLLKVGSAPAALIPGDALIVRPNGTQVAVVAGDRVHFQPIQVGRDFGQTTEVLSGLNGDEYLVVNATDDVREGAQVKPVLRAFKATPETQPVGSQEKRR
jgi:RND family efflux transporter MFP subunit